MIAVYISNAKIQRFITEFLQYFFYKRVSVISAPVCQQADLEAQDLLQWVEVKERKAFIEIDECYILP